jgi:Ca2+-binding EF-hand superfamily protein
MKELLNVRSTLLVVEMFQALDWSKTGGLDDIQFYSLMSYATDLKSHEIYKIFDLLDLDGSGSVEFDEVRRDLIMSSFTC